MDLTDEHDKAGKNGLQEVKEPPTDFELLLSDFKQEISDARDEIAILNRIPKDITAGDALGFANKINEVMDNAVYVLETQLGLRNGVQRQSRNNSMIDEADFKAANNFFLHCQGHFETVRDHITETSKAVRNNNKIDHRANIVIAALSDQLENKQDHDKTAQHTNNVVNISHHM